jgi:rubredoxin
MRGLELSTDYTGRCGNCHEHLGKDKYCRICGTKRGEGAFKPYVDAYYPVYGPKPTETTHKCDVCGYTWSTYLMIDKERYCPECGGRATVIFG